jgi:hypothetical protein
MPGVPGSLPILAIAVSLCGALVLGDVACKMATRAAARRPPARRDEESYGCRFMR